MDGLKRYVNDDRFRVDGDKNMRLLAFAFTIVFVWTGSKWTRSADATCIRHHFLADLHVTRHARETESQKRIRNTSNKP